MSWNYTELVEPGVPDTKMPMQKLGFLMTGPPEKTNADTLY